VRTNNTIFLLLVFFTQLTLGQTLYRKKISGKVSVSQIPVYSANVSNQSSDQIVVTDINGLFTVEVREGDILHISAVNVMAKELIISGKMFSSGYIDVVMDYANIQLDEVVISDKSKITAESVGVIPYNQKRYTQAERHLQTAGDFKPIMLLGLLGGSMPLDPLINKINGRTKRLKKLVALESKIALFGILNQEFEESYYVDKLKIPLDYIDGFKVFIIENDTFATYLKNNDLAMVQFLIIEQAVTYLEIIKRENP
jgi:hypothetical protein